ncbi:hypothetical protein SAMN04488502_105207 [Dendrosporobacter quercicolus]|uniref:Uncharacterized protein n=1 Tax=Dendrosporobacter quercicolus TaxID=146817 RepID=A0A1G9U7K9_9FIRM|nr:hypothetical protein SAMN04488502_105207 [Dendrosporobacter quercicolus]
MVAYRNAIILFILAHIIFDVNKFTTHCNFSPQLRCSLPAVARSLPLKFVAAVPCPGEEASRHYLAASLGGVLALVVFGRLTGFGTACMLTGGALPGIQYLPPGNLLCLKLKL